MQQFGVSPSCSEALSRVRLLAAGLEELFVQQVDRLDFHNDDKENDYRVQEDRLSTLMVDSSITDEKRREYAETLIRLSDSYKAVVLQGLQTLNDEIHRELVTFEHALDAMPSMQTDEESVQVADLRRWLSLSKDLHQARLMGTKSILLRVEMDGAIPGLYLRNNGQKDAVFTGDEYRRFHDGLADWRARWRHDSLRCQKARARS